MQHARTKTFTHSPWPSCLAMRRGFQSWLVALSRSIPRPARNSRQQGRWPFSAPIKAGGLAVLGGLVEVGALVGHPTLLTAESLKVLSP